jgi:sterol 14-demethylase
MRIVGCDEIADDPALLATTLSLFEAVESSATATAVLFPWFPSPAIIKRTIAGTRLYLIFKSVIDKRVASGRRGDDPLQYLLDQGDGVPAIIEVFPFDLLISRLLGY